MEERDAPRPLDVDGVLATSVGTAAWAVALVVAIAMHGSLQRHGHLWYLATAAVATGLGLLGIAYTLRRRRRLGAVADRPAE